MWLQNWQIESDSLFLHTGTNWYVLLWNHYFFLFSQNYWAHLIHRWILLFVVWYPKNCQVWPAQRPTLPSWTLSQIREDLKDSSKSGANVKNAKNFNNCTREPLFDIPLSRVSKILMYRILSQQRHAWFWCIILSLVFGSIKKSQDNSMTKKSLKHER